MEREYCVYAHIAPNGKRYVGITCCKPRNRRWQNGYGYNTQTLFYRAIKKYGWENFEHIILEDNLTAEEAGEKEKHYISLYKTDNRQYGYNAMEGGQVGFHLSEEHKAKISSSNSGKNNGQYGRRYTDEERKYMSEHSVWRGRKHTEETKRKIREYIKEHPRCPAHIGKDHPMARAVLQYDKSGKYINRYETAAEAEKVTGATRSGICTCAKGRIKTAGGYMWRYQTGEIEEQIPPVEPHRFNPRSIPKRKADVK